MQICVSCGSTFPFVVVTNGFRLDVRGRKRCLECRPDRPLRGPRKPVARPRATRTCDACGGPFALRQVIEGKLRHLYRRRFCLTCSPFGSRNSSRQPPGIADPEELKEYRRRRRNAKTYRYQKKQRRQRKAELITARGGRCERCGYHVSPAALEFHHRDAATKEFGLGNFAGSRERLFREAEKCDLLCANCHRMEHVSRDAGRPSHDVVEHRRRRKLRAVAYMGGYCAGCGRHGPPALFEFHHRDAREKDFGLSERGIPHRWEKIVGELVKCVMLCANCHREVHAGVRELDDGLLGLAEESGRYAAIAV